MAAWDALTVEEQERVIGRAKLSNVEMADDVKPSNSHVALNTIVDPDGTQRQILRDNMPFGSLGAGEFGTYFIGYAATPSVTELMLQHMFLGDPPGNYDRILDFSTAVTGTLFFVPTADFLDDPPPLPGEAGDATAPRGRGASPEETVPSGPAAAGDGSLGDRWAQRQVGVVEAEGPTGRCHGVGMGLVSQTRALLDPLSDAPRLHAGQRWRAPHADRQPTPRPSRVLRTIRGAGFSGSSGERPSR